MIIKNARLIKELTEGYDAPTADILVEGNVIADIKPCGYDFGEGHQVIDAKGNTVMPGIMDLHSHLSMSFIFGGDDPFKKSQTKSVFDCYRHATDYLKQGYTTLREMGTQKNIALDIRDLINWGRLVGPRIIASGEILTPTAPGNKWFSDLYQEADGADALQAAAREQITRRVDWLKYMATGAMLNKGGTPGARITTVAELKALQEVADLAGIKTAVHCHGAEAIQRCIECGINTIEHASLITEESIQWLVDHNESSYLVPTMAIGYTILGGPSCKKDPTKLTGGAKNVSADKLYVNDQSHTSIKNAYKAGLTLGFGSDIPHDSFNETPGLEFIARKECCDMENIDMLIQATINSAKIIDLDDKLGTIKVGKIADIIITDGNPDEDHLVMAKPMLSVIRDGIELISNGELTRAELPIKL